MASRGDRYTYHTVQVGFQWGFAPWVQGLGVKFRVFRGLWDSGVLGFLVVLKGWGSKKTTLNPSLFHLNSRSCQFVVIAPKKRQSTDPHILSDPHMENGCILMTLRFHNIVSSMCWILLGYHEPAIACRVFICEQFCTTCLVPFSDSTL